MPPSTSAVRLSPSGPELMTGPDVPVAVGTGMVLRMVEAQTSSAGQVCTTTPVALLPADLTVGLDNPQPDYYYSADIACQFVNTATGAQVLDLDLYGSYDAFATAGFRISRSSIECQGTDGVGQAFTHQAMRLGSNLPTPVVAQARLSLRAYISSQSAVPASLNVKGIGNPGPLWITLREHAG